MENPFEWIRLYGYAALFTGYRARHRCPPIPSGAHRMLPE